MSSSSSFPKSRFSICSFILIVVFLDLYVMEFDVNKPFVVVVASTTSFQDTKEIVSLSTQGDVSILNDNKQSSHTNHWNNGPIGGNSTILKRTFTMRKTGILPSFQNGGVVVFVHVPKVGGTTIRTNLQRFQHIEYRFGRNSTAYHDAVLPIVEETILHGSNGTIVVAEIHARDAPSLVRLRDSLLRWRTIATDNHVAFFAFTVVRQSLPYSLSHFNFFHVQKRNPTFEQCNATEQNFLRLSLRNPQCQFLAGGEPSMRAQKIKNRSISAFFCRKRVYDTLLDTMDWVGTTERLNNETLPLLKHLLHLTPSANFTNERVTHKASSSLKILKQTDLSASAINFVLRISALDREMYDRVIRDFRFQL